MAFNASDAPTNTTGEWIQAYLLTRPVRRWFSCFLEQALIEPFTSLPLPPYAAFALLFATLALLTIAASAVQHDADDEEDEEEGARRRRQTRRAAHRHKRRRTLWRWLTSGDHDWLQALPLYSLVFAYTASVATQTAVEAGLLRLPHKISEADWFDNAALGIKALLLWIKLTDLGVVLCSLLFSETVLTWALHALNEGRPETHKVELVGWRVALITACQLLLWGASYVAVALSALLLFANLLTFLVAQLPLVVYSQGIYNKLGGTFIGRYLNNEIEKFFQEHEFLRVADDFRVLVLPFAALSFVMQLNLLLCSHHLVLQTRRRLASYSLLRHIDVKLHLSRLWAWQRKQRGLGEEEEGLGHGVTLQTVHAAAEKARARVRERGRRAKGAGAGTAPLRAHVPPSPGQ